MLLMSGHRVSTFKVLLVLIIGECYILVLMRLFICLYGMGEEPALTECKERRLAAWWHDSEW